MELDNDVRSSTSPSVAVLEKLESFFSAGITPDDLDWWASHPYAASPGGRNSPWRRVPELQRQLFSAHAPSDHEEVLAVELRSLQESLGRFREAMAEAARGEEDSAETSPHIAVVPRTAPPPLEHPVAATAENPGRTLRSKRPVLLITAGCVGVISIAALVSQLVPHEEVGLQVFDRPQTAADNTTYTNDRAGNRPVIVLESTRLLGEEFGYSFFGARTRNGEICLITDDRDSASAHCVPESEFVDQGIIDDFVGYIMASDRPPGFEDGDYIHVEWTNQLPLILSSSHTDPLAS